ncbi:hypothetical protein ITP53_15195 [Nonomuraea sp. K274]|uniref:Uncharacterized protein n=1 Tax=Nonomuraea cypriaca TaxID=1187855 RepID=A0A931F146_9ACTN|nr:hypothetical protein [Nonomuraea cypriaca]MBF8187058.1 hypothetical protein [Nonomuraea cypriaca]
MESFPGWAEIARQDVGGDILYISDDLRVLTESFDDAAVVLAEAAPGWADFCAQRLGVDPKSGS